jgi:hypothetical protein
MSSDVTGLSEEETAFVNLEKFTIGYDLFFGPH